MTEDKLHLAICKYIKAQYPNVIFNSDGAGVKLTMGQSVKAKAMRSSKGFPDLFVIEQRGGYSGLFIELKKEGIRLKKLNGMWVNDHVAEQAIMLDKLRLRNFMACFAVGFDEAKKIIDEFLKLK